MGTAEDQPQNPIDVVTRLVGAIEAGDVDTVRSVYAPGAVVWTCFDDHERDIDSSMRVIEWLVGASTERRYEVTRRIEIEGGVLQQHVLHVTTNEGRKFSMPACLVIRITDGCVTRIDEYLDPKPVADGARMTSLSELADGVYAWIQPDGSTGVSNAGVVVDDDGLTIIDTLMVRSQWEPFVAAVAELGFPVKRVLLTHAHIDHVGGTQAFRNAMVLGSPATSELLDQPMPVDAYKTYMATFAEEFDDLAELGTRPVSHIVADAAQLTPRVELLPASGHTPGDVMALVADADLLFAGDLCFFGVTPLAFQGDPTTWADVLDAVADLADVIVPGHGPVGSAAEVRELQAYLRHCVEGVIPPGPWDQWSERDERDPVNIEKAAMLRAGDTGMPPAMLKLITPTP